LQSEHLNRTKEKQLRTNFTISIATY